VILSQDEVISALEKLGGQAARPQIIKIMVSWLDVNEHTAAKSLTAAVLSGRVDSNRGKPPIYSIPK